MENMKNLMEKGGEIEKYEKFHWKIGGKIEKFEKYKGKHR